MVAVKMQREKAAVSRFPEETRFKILDGILFDTKVKNAPPSFFPIEEKKIGFSVLNQFGDFFSGLKKLSKVVTLKYKFLYFMKRKRKCSAL